MKDRTRRWLLGGFLGGAVLASGGLAALLVLGRPFPPPEFPLPPVPSDAPGTRAALSGSASLPPGADPLPPGPGPGWGDPERPVLLPFHLGFDPMETLLLLNIEGDPDRVYLGFEPQRFDDEVHGRGILVLGWRRDGRVDVFHDPELALDPATYGIAGGGLHQMEPRDFSGGILEVGPLGMRASLTFRDLEDRAIRLEVEETDPRPRRPLSLLAPMGAAATHPPALPLVYLHGFDFVRRRGSRIRIEVDGRAHAPDLLPVPMGGARVTFLRYAAHPFIVTWNPPGADALHPLAGPSHALAGPLHPPVDPSDPPPGPETHPRDESVVVDGVHWGFQARDGWIEIAAMERQEGGVEEERRVRVEFEPPLPHLTGLRPGDRARGSFRIGTHPSTGWITGRWEVERRDHRLHLALEPTGGWTPDEPERMVRLMYRIVPTFRAWPSTYRWEGVLELDRAPDGGFPFHAEWRRTP